MVVGLYVAVCLSQIAPNSYSVYIIFFPFMIAPSDCFFIFVLGSLKMKPYVNNLSKEGGSKDDQLSLDVKSLNMKNEISKDRRSNGKQAQTFTFEELAAATSNFRSDCFLGEGGFGKVYKGYLDKINQVRTK